MVAVAAVGQETQLPRGALCGDEFEGDFLLQEGAEVAGQVVAQQRGKEEVEPQQGHAHHHDEPAGGEHSPGSQVNLLQTLKQFHSLLAS